MRTYTTVQDYINQNIVPGLGDVELTLVSDVLGDT